LLARQLPQDLPVVARTELAFARDLHGEARDLLAHLGKRQHAERNGLLRRYVDADRFQPVGIQLARQRVVLSRPGKNHLAYPLAMRAQLGREPLMGALPVAHFARAKQFRYAGDVALAVPEVLAHFGFVGPDEPGAGEALAGACARQLGEGRDATLQAGIDAHALQGIAMPRLAVARIEEHLQPLEDVLREVEVRDEETMLECPRASLALDGIDEQVEVLPDPGVLFRLPQRGEPLQHAARGGFIAGGPAWLEVERRRIEALEPQRRSVLGLERAERLEYDRRYAVATLDPGAVFGSAGQRRAQRSCERHEKIEATDG